MKARWNHPCSDCVLIAQTDDCDIYRCEDDRITFRAGDGKDNAVHVDLDDIQTAVRAIDADLDAKRSRFNDGYVGPDEGIM